jgi:lysophospholipase L1-like esterase
MIWKNIEIQNVAELIENGDGSVSWRRVPLNVQNGMEHRAREDRATNSTGVELRFVIRGEKAIVRMSTAINDPEDFATFHVFRGGVQGGWRDHEVHRHVTGEVQDFVIERSKNMEKLKVMTEKSGLPWDCEVVRIIFDRGSFKIYDVLGDVVPPTKEQCPEKMIMAYGSSITHGSNSIDTSHTWAQQLAHNLGMDVRNLGMAGACAMEPEIAEYIASEGEKGAWDLATLELGINVLNWPEEKIYSRVENIIRQVAGRNPEKPVFVISPFYHCGEDFDEQDNAKNWRRIMGEITHRLAFENVTYIDGLEVLNGMEYISADEVHPNIYGVQRIADVLTQKIKAVL